MTRLAYLLLAAAACGGAPAGSPDAFVDGGAIQLDDVSILFPLSSSYLAASAHGDRGTLLPAALYDAIGHLSGSSGEITPGGTGDAAYADLRVVAMRLDPCFAALAPDPHGDGCDNQLRLVFQEVREVDGAPVAFDSGLHAFYRISRADLVTLAHAIASERAANGGGARLGALAIHPILAAQGTDGAMGAGLRTLILRYAGQDNLVRVTEMSSGNTGFSWTFSGFDVQDARGARFTKMVIPTLQGAEAQSFFRGFEADVSGQFQPSTTSSDDLSPLADEGRAAQLTPEQRAAAFHAVARVDNPTRHSPDTIDCGSCHLATPIAKLVGPRFGLVEADEPDVFHADGTFVLASEMGATFDPNGPFDVHAFSYVGVTPSINQRTVNETAAVVAYLNAL